MQGYLNKLKAQTRELLQQSHRALDLMSRMKDDEPWTLREVEYVAQELAAAAAETEELLRK